MMCIVTFSCCNPDKMPCDPVIQIEHYDIGSLHALYNGKEFDSDGHYKNINGNVVFFFNKPEEYGCFNDMSIDLLYPFEVDAVTLGDTLFLQNPIGSLTMFSGSDSIFSVYGISRADSTANWVIINERDNNNSKILVGEMNLVLEIKIPEEPNGFIIDGEPLPNEIVFNEAIFEAPLVD